MYRAHFELYSAIIIPRHCCCPPPSSFFNSCTSHLSIFANFYCRFIPGHSAISNCDLLTCKVDKTKQAFVICELAFVLKSTRLIFCSVKSWTFCCVTLLSLFFQHESFVSDFCERTRKLFDVVSTFTALYSSHWKSDCLL